MRTKRVAVTSPQTRLAHSRRRARTRSPVAKLEAGDAGRAVRIYRAQRRMAVTALALLFAFLLGLPLALSLLPSLGEVRLFSIPVSWLAVAVLPYPVLVLLARWQLRRAEHAEDRE
ncbi:hypothetical protein [Amycolatopsis magusensis]|uniref:DUF485 domain-containing protein n=1 Tax=Amycolatopsis magusensis TaxID=882444 RepID=A0ABS4Q5Z9_9PSEU|nr:hypothetical protein [Amycolatopsis magusensis]MBP2186519.1 hypothetical protein [Amycolatopsis magusensis]MDI5978347.1 hypothetical protein [Amycolatopsis magusensis]